MPDLAGPTVADPGAPARSELTDQEAAQRAFSTSLVVSGTRCLLTYVVLPFLAPALGLAAGVGPGLGIVIGTVAIGANVLTIRRLHASMHRWRWAYTVIAVSVIGMLLVMLGQDLGKLL